MGIYRLMPLGRGAIFFFLLMGQKSFSVKERTADEEGWVCCGVG
jgi:hypothetical protein